MKLAIPVALLVLAITATGCRDAQLQAQLEQLRRDQAQNSNQIVRINDQINYLTNATSFTLTNTSYLLFRAATLERQMKETERQLQQIPQASINFDASRAGFKMVSTAAGNLIVSIEDATEQLDGYRIKFSIGNPNFSTINNAKITVGWGLYWENQNEVVISKGLAPGTWTRCEMTIAPAKPAELRDLLIGVRAEGVRLNYAP